MSKPSALSPLQIKRQQREQSFRVMQDLSTFYQMDLGKSLNELYVYFKFFDKHCQDMQRYPLEISTDLVRRIFNNIINKNYFFTAAQEGDIDVILQLLSFSEIVKNKNIDQRAKEKIIEYGNQSSWLPFLNRKKDFFEAFEAAATDDSEGHLLVVQELDKLVDELAVENPKVLPLFEKSLLKALENAQSSGKIFMVSELINIVMKRQMLSNINIPLLRNIYISLFKINDIDTIEKLLSELKNLGAEDISGFRAQDSEKFFDTFETAAANGHEKSVDLLFHYIWQASQNIPKLQSSLRRSLFKAISHAVAQGNIEIREQLFELAKKLEISKKEIIENNQYELLLVAIRSNQVEIMNSFLNDPLLDAGKMFERIKETKSFEEACKNGHSKTVAALLKFFHSLENGNQVVREMLGSHLYPAWLNEPFCLALKDNHPAVIKILLHEVRLLEGLGSTELRNRMLYSDKMQEGQEFHAKTINDQKYCKIKIWLLEDLSQREDYEALYNEFQKLEHNDFVRNIFSYGGRIEDLDWLLAIAAQLARSEYGRSKNFDAFVNVIPGRNYISPDTNFEVVCRWLYEAMKCDERLKPQDEDQSKVRRLVIGSISADIMPAGKRDYYLKMVRSFPQSGNAENNKRMSDLYRKLHREINNFLSKEIEDKQKPLIDSAFFASNANVDRELIRQKFMEKAAKAVYNQFDSDNLPPEFEEDVKELVNIIKAENSKLYANRSGEDQTSHDILQVEEKVENLFVKIIKIKNEANQSNRLDAELSQIMFYVLGNFHKIKNLRNSHIAFGARAYNLGPDLSRVPPELREEIQDLIFPPYMDSEPAINKMVKQSLKTLGITHIQAIEDIKESRRKALEDSENSREVYARAKSATDKVQLFADAAKEEDLEMMEAILTVLNEDAEGEKDIEKILRANNFSAFQESLTHKSFDVANKLIEAAYDVSPQLLRDMVSSENIKYLAENKPHIIDYLAVVYIDILLPKMEGHIDLNKLMSSRNVGEMSRFFDVLRSELAPIFKNEQRVCNEKALDQEMAKIMFNIFVKSFENKKVIENYQESKNKEVNEVANELIESEGFKIFFEGYLKGPITIEYPRATAVAPPASQEVWEINV